MNSSNEFDFIGPLRKQRVKKIIAYRISPEAKLRYQQAHELNFKDKYPVAYAEGRYCLPNFPKFDKANGLTNAVINFIMWNGYRATRISSSGRMVQGKFIPGTTRKGAADVSSTIKGRSVMWEIKVGQDKPSPEQLREQELERKAGGEYFFVRTFEGFLEEWDKIIGL